MWPFPYKNPLLHQLNVSNMTPFIWSFLLIVAVNAHWEGYRWEHDYIPRVYERRRTPPVGSGIDVSAVPSKVLRNFGLMDDYGKLPTDRLTFDEFGEIEDKFEFFSGNANNAVVLLDIPITTLVRTFLEGSDPRIRKSLEWMVAHVLNVLYTTLDEAEPHFLQFAHEIYPIRIGKSNCLPAKPLLLFVEERCVNVSQGDPEYDLALAHGKVAYQLYATYRLVRELLKENQLTPAILLKLLFPSRSSVYMGNRLLRGLFWHNEKLKNWAKTYKRILPEFAKNFGLEGEFYERVIRSLKDGISHALLRLTGITDDEDFKSYNHMMDELGNGKDEEQTVEEGGKVMETKENSEETTVEPEDDQNEMEEEKEEMVTEAEKKEADH